MAGNDPVANLGGSGAGAAAAATGAAAISKATASGMGADAGQPGLWVPAGAPFVQQIANAGFTANRGYAIRFVCPRNIALTRIGFAVTTLATANDSCDVGIYNADGSVLLSSSGGTAGKLNAATGMQTLPLLAPVSLLSGQVYFAAIAHGAIGGTSAQFAGASPNAGLLSAFGAAMPFLEIVYRDNKYPLSAPLAPFGPTTNVPIMALLS